MSRAGLTWAEKCAACGEVLDDAADDDDVVDTGAPDFDPVCSECAS